MFVGLYLPNIYVICIKTLFYLLFPIAYVDMIIENQFKWSQYYDAESWFVSEFRPLVNVLSPTSRARPIPDIGNTLLTQSTLRVSLVDSFDISFSLFANS